MSHDDGDNDNANILTPRSQPPQLTPQTPDDNRQRTRGATLRLSASLKQLSRQQVLEKLKTCSVNTALSLSFSSAPLWNEETALVTVIAAGEGGTRLVKMPDGNATILPFKDARVITNIIVHHKSTIDVPLNLSNNNIDHSAPTIYVDGGSRPNPGCSAAAIVARLKTSPTDFTTTTHAHFYALATNNIVECIAMLAAMRYAHRLIQDGASHVNVVGDSEIVYRLMLGIAKTDDKKLLPIVEQIREAFLPIAGKLTIATMKREHGNPADYVCTKAILSAQHEGDESLFIPVPVLPTMPRVQHRTPAASILHPQTKFNIPETLSEFASIRRYHSRSKVPEPVTHLWALLVKYYLTNWAEASTPHEKHEAAIRFLLLPHLFLPTSASTTRIIKHLELAQPFGISPDSSNTARRNRTHDTNHRATEAITRLVNDRKLGAANKLVHAMAEADDMSTHEKHTLLKTKILDGAFTSPFPTQQIPLISPAEVLTALKKANKNASNAVDGWTKDLLFQAINFDIEIANLLGQLFTWLMQDASHKTKSFFLLSRVIAIPKISGSSRSVRPISVSSIFVKLLGTIAVTRDGNLPSHMQYAIGKPEGHKRIIHKILKHMNSSPNAAIVKIDCTNAYGSLPRKTIAEARASHDPTLKQYFSMVYGTRTQLVMYDNTDGSPSHTFTTIGEGVKQGDATSSFLFCIGLDKALYMIQDTLKLMGITAHIYAYMDDLTIVCDAADTARVSSVAIAALNKIGLEVNEEKSSILASMHTACPLPHTRPAQPFIVLGANVSPHPNAISQYTDSLLRKQNNYFEHLQSLPLHPQILFTILKICGYPHPLPLLHHPPRQHCTCVTPV
jgi:ribonuclease HI